MRPLFLSVVLLILAGCSQRNPQKQYSSYKTSRDKLTETSVLLGDNGDTVIAAGKYAYLQLDGQDMLLAHKGDKWGWINVRDSIVIPFEYDDAGHFEEGVGLAFVGKVDKYGYINRRGELVIPLKYDDGVYFQGLSATIKLDGKYGMIDACGKEIVPIEYDDRISSHLDTIVALKKDRKWAFFSQQGRQLSGFDFDAIEATNRFALFNNGPALVRQAGQYAYVDTHMNFVVPYGVYSKAQTFNSLGLAIVKQGGYGIIDQQGKLVIPTQYSEIEQLNTYQSKFYNILLLRKGHALTFLNKDLLPITNATITTYIFNGSLLARNDTGKWGVFNGDGVQTVPFLYDNMEKCYHHRALIVSDKKHYGMISYDNEIFLPLEYDAIEPIWQTHYVSATKNGKCGLFNDKGEGLIPMDYEAIYLSTHNVNEERCFIVQKDDKMGVIDIHNQSVVPSVYDALSGWVEYGPNAYFARQGTKYGIITPIGIVVVPLEYDYVGLPEAGVVPVGIDRKYGIRTMTNTELLPCIFDAIVVDIDTGWGRSGPEDRLILKKDGKWSYYDPAGNLLKEDVTKNEIEKHYRWHLNWSTPISTDEMYDMKRPLTVKNSR